MPIKRSVQLKDVRYSCGVYCGVVLWLLLSLYAVSVYAHYARYATHNMITISVFIQGVLVTHGSELTSSSSPLFRPLETGRPVRWGNSVGPSTLKL